MPKPHLEVDDHFRTIALLTLHRLDPNHNMPLNRIRSNTLNAPGCTVLQTTSQGF